MAEGSRDLTTFGSPLRQFRFKRMPFGLKNAPAIFQEMVEDVLRPCQDVIGVYIDDVLVYSDKWTEHLEALDRVLCCLKEAGLKVKLKKCSFGRCKLRYLGHYIGSWKLRVPADRVESLA